MAVVPREFVRESNRIENIVREPTIAEMGAHERLLSRRALDVVAVEEFVRVVADAPLRRAPGQDVTVGGYRPHPGGPEIEEALSYLLDDINLGEITPWEGHLRYERLHPFLDGNGRSGRAIWAWHMRKEGRDPFVLSFLRSYYYATLAEALDAD